MKSSSPLPPRLRGQPFLVRHAIDAGLSRGRLRGTDLVAPFRGIRSDTFDAMDLPARCRALQLRLPPHAFFSHSTAALVMGLPLPLTLETHPLLHVSVFDPRQPPRIRGIVPHQIALVSDGTREWRGVRLAPPVLTWCLLAEQLSVPDLVAVADYLLTGDYPLATVSELAAAIDSRGGQRNVRKLVRALPEARSGPLSRPETHARLLYVAAGLPEPEINGNIYDDRGRFVAMSDLVWRAQRVANEYEGNHHQERRQFRKDILRRERIEDLGWRVTRFTADDLRLRPEETITRTASRLGLTVSPARMKSAVALSKEFAI